MARRGREKGPPGAFRRSAKGLLLHKCNRHEEKTLLGNFPDCMAGPGGSG